MFWRRPAALMVSAVLLLACLAGHQQGAEARATKGPGKYRPRIADHMNAAHRMVYVAAASGNTQPTAVGVAQAASKAPAHIKPAAARSKAPEKLPQIVPAVPHKSRDSKAAEPPPLKAVIRESLISVAVNNKPGSKQAPAPAPASTTTFTTRASVADALTAAGDVPVSFHAPAAAQQFNTPKPVVHSSPGQQAAAEKDAAHKQSNISSQPAKASSDVHSSAAVDQAGGNSKTQQGKPDVGAAASSDKGQNPTGSSISSTSGNLNKVVTTPPNPNLVVKRLDNTPLGYRTNRPEDVGGKYAAHYAQPGMWRSEGAAGTNDGQNSGECRDDA